MKGKFLALVIGAFALAAIGATSAMAVKPDDGYKGNGLPLVPMKYAERLNLSAHDQCPSANQNGGGNIIFLKADYEWGSSHPQGVLNDNDIELAFASSFDVLDRIACDGTAAKFQMPSDVSTSWLAFLKVVGPLNSGVDIATCGYDEDTGELICNAGVVKVKGKGGPGGNDSVKFSNVTNTLLSLLGEDLGQGIYNDEVEDILFWEVFTNGRAKAHIVFLPCGGTTLDGETLPLSCQAF